MSINPGSFVPSARGYVSYSEDSYSPSPIYIITAACKRLLAEEQRVKLPQGWSHRDLDKLTSITGQYGKEVAVTYAQAHEVVDIGQELLSNFKNELSPAEIEAINWLTRFIER